MFTAPVAYIRKKVIHFCETNELHYSHPDTLCWSQGLKRNGAIPYKELAEDVNRLGSIRQVLYVHTELEAEHEMLC